MVESRSHSLLLTACHCLQSGGTFSLIRSITSNDDGTTVLEPSDPIQVQVVVVDTISDVAILKANQTFPDAIKLCPAQEYPTAIEEDVVKSYHCPISMFLDGAIDSISVMATSYNKLLVSTSHHLYVTGEHMRGSAGGVVVDAFGRAVGLICSGYVPGIRLPGDYPSLDTAWENLTVLSNGTGSFTKAVQLQAIPDLEGYLATH